MKKAWRVILVIVAIAITVGAVCAMTGSRRLRTPYRTGFSEEAYARLPESPVPGFGVFRYIKSIPTERKSIPALFRQSRWSGTLSHTMTAHGAANITGRIRT